MTAPKIQKGKKDKGIENEYYRHLERRLFDMSALFDVSQALNSSLDLHAILDSILLTTLGKFTCNRGMVLLRKNDHIFTIESARGPYRKVPLGTEVEFEVTSDEPHLLSLEAAPNGLHTEYKLYLCVPIRKKDKTIGLICLGQKNDGKPYDKNELEFVTSLANIAATSIENALVYGELKDLNRQLDLKIQELNSLFEIGGELNSSLDENQILWLLTLTLMGQMTISKSFVLTHDENREDTLKVAIKRGIDSSRANADLFQENDFEGLFSRLDEALFVEDMTDDAIRTICCRAGITHLIPMKIKEDTRGILGVSGKLSDKSPVRFTENEIAYLATLANQTMIALENARLFKVAIEKERMEKELEVAKEIQRSLLPSKNPTHDMFDFAGANLSSFQVGGDYYDFLQLGSDSLGVAIGDVTGKGVPAALLMANLHAYLHAQAENHKPISAMMDQLNHAVHASAGSTNKFITFFYGYLNLENKSFIFSNAGHNYPIIFHKNGEKDYLEKGGLPLGMFPGAPYEEDTVTLAPGDLLVMYTDGVSEALNPNDEDFGEERLEMLVADNRHLSANELLDLILAELEKFTAGTPQSDDITLVLVKVLENYT